MYKSYLKIAWRNLRKNRIFSTINIVGLAMGIAAFGLILEYVSFQRSFNQFHQNRAQTYRVLLQSPTGTYSDFVPTAIAPALKQNVGDVKAFCRLAYVQNGIVTLAGEGKAVALRSFRESKSLCADGDFFRIFSFPLVAGVPSLQRPNTVAISATKARTYFGGSVDLGRVVGKVLTLNNQFGKAVYTITAVFADVPANSDLQFDMVYALSTLATATGRNGNDWARLDSWEGGFSQSVVWLNANANPSVLEANANNVARTLYPKATDQIRLQPLRYVHLGDGLVDTRPTNGKVGFVYLLSGIAGLILLIAWLNYVNLTTAGSLKRAKEVGVRKVVGADRTHIIGQFLGESLLLNLLGFGLALILMAVLQGPFNQLIGQQLSFATFATGQLWLAGLVLILVGAVASGGYAAFALSGLPAVSVMKGVFARYGSARLMSGGQIRQSLVVFQFVISMVLIVATVVLHRQLTFMQNQDLGMNLRQLLVIKGAEVGDDAARQSGRLAFRNELAQLPYVERFSNSGSVPGSYYNFNADGITRLSRSATPGDDKKSYAITYFDENFLPTYDIALVAGQNFTAAQCTREPQADRVMLNQKAAKALGFESAQAAVGQKIKFGSEFEIVGVTKDYHHQSLQQAIQPLLIFPRYSGANYTLRLTTDRIQAKVGELEQLYKQIFPGNPFEYYFVDEQYNQQYQTEQQYGRIFTTAASLAILIACLGLFGLAAFTAEQRTKEIGVRKVLGASVGSIVTLLSKDFLKLVLTAIVIASPIAWYAMNRWLQDFAYKIDIEWWVFALAGLLAVGIALLTVSFQSVKAALMNPVKSLRSE